MSFYFYIKLKNTSNVTPIESKTTWNKILNRGCHKECIYQYKLFVTNDGIIHIYLLLWNSLSLTALLQSLKQCITASNIDNKVAVYDENIMTASTITSDAFNGISDDSVVDITGTIETEETGKILYHADIQYESTLYPWQKQVMEMYTDAMQADAIDYTIVIRAKEFSPDVGRQWFINNLIVRKKAVYTNTRGDFTDYKTLLSLIGNSIHFTDASRQCLVIEDHYGSANLRPLIDALACAQEVRTGSIYWSDPVHAYSTADESIPFQPYLSCTRYFDGALPIIFTFGDCSEVFVQRNDIRLFTLDASTKTLMPVL